LGKIRINNMKFYTFNGVLEEEQVLGQNIEIDIQLETPFDASSAEDDLEKTINYAEVYSLIKKLCRKPFIQIDGNTCSETFGRSLRKI
jgi:FolB domain-containing protein